MFKTPWKNSYSNPNDFENPPEYNPDEFSSWWKAWFTHLMLVVKLALKNKMCNTIKLETQDQRVPIKPPKGKCSATTMSGNYTVDGCHMNF